MARCRVLTRSLTSHLWYSTSSVKSRIPWYSYEKGVPYRMSASLVEFIGAVSQPPSCSYRRAFVKNDICRRSNLRWTSKPRIVIDESGAPVRGCNDRWQTGRQSLYIVTRETSITPYPLILRSSRIPILNYYSFRGISEKGICLRVIRGANDR